MAVCGPANLPYEQWLGGKPGRWGALSRAAAEAWRVREAQRCQLCGLFHDVDSGWLEVDEDGELVAVDHRRRPLLPALDYCPATDDANRFRKANELLLREGDQFIVWVRNPHLDG